MAPLRRTLLRICCAPLLIALLVAGCQGGASGGDATAVAGDSDAYIQNKGSDTIVNLALAWAERYQQLHPEVRISVTGGGTGTGMNSLMNGTVDIANASRQITSDESDASRQQGITPVEHVIARDAIAVIVNPNNPVDSLTLEQISRIFRGEITNWTQVGGEDRPVVRVSRETNSGTHVYFLEEVVRLGEDTDTIFAADTLLLPSSEGIISEVGDNPNAIGYDGLGYVTEHVKTLGITPPEGGQPVMPSVDTVNQGTYPISRDLYMYTREDANEAISAYLTWILSSEAQEIVTGLGFVPVSQP